jgi:hypothetical protein
MNARPTPLEKDRAATPHLDRLEVAFSVASATLERFIGHAGRPAPPFPPPSDPPAALDILVGLFGLSPFERDLLVLAAGAELSAPIADLCGLAQKSPDRPFMTFGLALAAQPDSAPGALAPGAALAPDGALRRWGLIEFDPAAPGGPMSARLSVPESVVRFLMGAPTLDARLTAVLERVAAPAVLQPSLYRLAEQIAATAQTAPPAPALHLVGPPTRSALEIVAGAASLVGLTLYRLPHDRLPPEPERLAQLVRLWNRDRVLVSGALAVTVGSDEAAAPGAEAALTRLADDVHGFLVLSGTGGGELSDRCLRPVLRIEAPPPDPYEIREAWRELLGDHPRVADMAYQFRLPVETMAAAARAVHAYAGETEDEDAAMARLWDLCRVQGRQKLTGLAQRLPARAGLDDLVLSDSLKSTLRQVIAHHRHRPSVLLDGGFEARGAREAGLSILLAGPSGVGKTMAAEVLANALSLDLFRVDLSQVVNKYIGETEKNLRRVFDAADEGGAILLFDEADALFGKRSEVKDSHDRHANIEVGYLLQRIESYRGIAILTTNMPDALDQAFLRRLAYILHIPFPDRDQRADIWSRAFPAETPTESLDLPRLAQLSVTGGQIRGIALNAAMLAAAEGKPVDMAVIRQAAHTEYGKLNRIPTTTELAGWP